MDLEILPNRVCLYTYFKLGRYFPILNSDFDNNVPLNDVFAIADAAKWTPS
jgi:hypothetical protein